MASGASKQPWRPHYTRDWALDPFVRELDPECRTVYSELLDISWEEGGLQWAWLFTGAHVAKRIGITRRKFAACWERVRGKFEEISPGVWSNPRLEIERVRTKKYAENQSNRAKQKKTDQAAAQPASVHLAS